MKKYYFIALTILLTACGGETKVTRDKEFNEYKEAFVLRLWKMYPEWASSIGYHKYDDQLTIPDKEREKEELAFLDAEAKKLKEFKEDELSADNQIDLELIQNFLESSKWSQKEFNSG